MSDEETFDAVMETITSGLTGEAKHDGAYLMEQAERYKDHEFGKEIVRAIGRMMFDVLPKEDQDELGQLIKNHGRGRESVYEETVFNLRSGNPQKACDLIAPLIAEFDSLTADGFDSSDAVTLKLDFANLQEFCVYAAVFHPDKDIKPTVEHYARAYALYAAALFELGRHDEAISYLEKTLHWDPVSVDAYFEFGENYKARGEMERADDFTEKAYPFIYSATQMARYHRNKGFYFIETGRFELAVAHLLVSTIFETHPLAASEIMYIKQRYGQDFTDMEVNEALHLLDEAGEKITVSTEVIEANHSLLSHALANDDLDTAIEVLGDLWRTTMDDDAKELMDKLIVKRDGSNAENN